MRRIAPPNFAAIILIFASISPAIAADPPTALDSRLALENPARLATDVRASGDPVRGALVFYRPALQCAKCHVGEKDKPPPLGPDLARIGRAKADRDVVESILAPSKTIREGFEPVTIAMHDGKTIVGLRAGERPDAILVRDPARDGLVVTIARKDVDELKTGGTSLMPSGLVNQLVGRAEFLDLVRYVLEINEGGPSRALALRPPESAFAVAPLPEYEHHVDHRGMIAELGPENYRRGQTIYERACVNCHGTQDRPGSLPTSLRFASGLFKNGADPYRMYQTLTVGTGQMVAQSWMVPEQKYDVIHYIREAYLKPHNPSQFVRVDPAYLANLPRGDTRGPRPSAVEPWLVMDYGPSFSLTCEIGDDGSNFAYKGVATRLDHGGGGISRGHAWVVFEHDTLRLAAGWTGDSFIDWRGINFTGEHEVHPRITGSVAFANPTGLGWANPETGSFDDPRPKGRDGRPYGPLPRSWGHYRGQYRHGDRVILSYSIGETDVLETSAIESDGATFCRTIQIGPRKHSMILQVARAPRERTKATESGVTGLTWSHQPDGDLRLGIAAGESPIQFTIKLTRRSTGTDAPVLKVSLIRDPSTNVADLTHGGSPRWPDVLKTAIKVGRDDGPFATDVLTSPDANPWNARMRFSGLDFFAAGDALAVCTWDGDVWRVEGLHDPAGTLSWRRIAAGLFQPLGLKIVGGVIHVGCRDQIVALRDVNGDGETDFYENVNSDHQVTEHFHEFAMDLQTDAEGNFYYAKAARHGKTALVPQHGTLLKVARDGSKTEILATGFRAPNGVCLNPDGTFFSTDQEGFWLPKNRINHVVRGGFYGNMWGYHDVTDPSDSAMKPPVCWITNAMDRSPAEPVWIPAKTWGPLAGSLLNLSYGMGKVFIVPHETVEGVMQGGVCELPGVSFPTGVMRGRFQPTDGQLYACGLYGWAGNRDQPGGLYRLRYTGKPVYVPIGLHARKGRLDIRLSGAIDPGSAADPSAFSVSTWTLRRSENYGSKHYYERRIDVPSSSLSADARTVSLNLPDLGPTQCMEVVYDLRGSSGEPVKGRLHNSIHHVGN